jgi:serine/threonine protein kinase
MMTTPPSDSHLPAYGSLVGPWIVRACIGSGSHGTVFRAAHKDRPEDERYALKVASRAGDERFEREAWLLSRIRHSSVPRFEDRGTWKCPLGEAHPYVVMQWVEGLLLYAWPLEHGLTLRRAISLLAQVARALEAVHRRGVHRDVKGGNIRVSAEGHAVLLDFSSCWYPSASPLTGREMPPGTRCYFSPQLLFFEYALTEGAGEHYEAQPADDVYALGVTAYRLLAGGYPPDNPDSGSGKPPRGLKDAFPELAELIERMLSEDPLARGSAKAVAEELEALREYSSPALDEPWEPNASQEPTERAAPPAPREDAPGDAPRKPAPRLAPAVPREPAPTVAPTAPKEPAPPVVPAAPKEPAPPVAPAAPKESSTSLGPAGVFILLVLLGVLLTRGADRTSTEGDRRSHAAGSPDAGPSGLGEEGLASVSRAETPPDSKAKVTRKVPPEPLSGQQLPPCAQRGAVVINGGCWRLPSIEAEKAPCDSDLYEHEGRCYSPILISAKRVPTSNEPQQTP